MLLVSGQFQMAIENVDPSRWQVLREMLGIPTWWNSDNTLEGLSPENNIPAAIRRFPHGRLLCWGWLFHILEWPNGQVHWITTMVPTIFFTSTLALALQLLHLENASFKQLSNTINFLSLWRPSFPSTLWQNIIWVSGLNTSKQNY